MKVFFSTFPHQHEALNRCGVRHRLLSYNDLRAPRVLRKLEAASSVSQALGITPPDGQEFMLDSGAYSAWKRGAVIRIDEYIAFVLKYSKFFDWIVNLDVIPGKSGRQPSAAEVDRSAEIGWQNYYALKTALCPEEGAKLVHVFHRREHKRWLEKLLDEGGDYIGISPGTDRLRQRSDWLDIIKPCLTDAEGRPRRRCHAFGVTALEILLRHLWLHSVDSTSWARAAQFGSCSIAVPSTPVPKARTIRFSRRGSSDPQHFDRLTKSDQALVSAYLRHLRVPEVPMQSPRVAKRLRAEVNVKYFQNMERFLEFSEREMGSFVIRFVRPDRPADTAIAKALS